MDDESGEKPLEEMLQDTKRIRYYQEYLTAVLQAIRYDPNAHV
jgi:beta-glucosidase/6-phospho-beta-glucosidase/beta-galactosidase